MTTHAHYAGEFGAQKMTKKLEKDPAYRAARAEHYANEAHSANAEHAKLVASGGSKAKIAEHALIAAHAEKRTAVHADAAQKLAPGSEHAEHATNAYKSAKEAHTDIKNREAVAHEKAVSTAVYSEHKAAMDRMHPTGKVQNKPDFSKPMPSSNKQPLFGNQKPDMSGTQNMHGQTHEKAAYTQLATQRTDRANKISAIAKVFPSAAAHIDAANAHRAAAVVHQEIGNHAKVSEHEEKADFHAKTGDKMLSGMTMTDQHKDAVAHQSKLSITNEAEASVSRSLPHSSGKMRESAIASKVAEITSSRVATGGASHSQAAEAHNIAAKVAREAGDSLMSKIHTSEAKKHQSKSVK